MERAKLTRFEAIAEVGRKNLLSTLWNLDWLMQNLSCTSLEKSAHPDVLALLEAVSRYLQDHFLDEWANNFRWIPEFIKLRIGATGSLPKAGSLAAIAEAHKPLYWASGMVKLMEGNVHWWIEGGEAGVDAEFMPGIAEAHADEIEQRKGNVDARTNDDGDDRSSRNTDEPDIDYVSSHNV